MGGHIQKTANLPLLEHHQRKLAIKSSRKTSKGYEDTWIDWTSFGMDLATTRQGHKSYEKGLGRVTVTTPLGSPRPVQPADKPCSGVILVTVANETGLAELEIADTDMVAAFKPLIQDFIGSDEAEAGYLPIVRFVSGLAPKFVITDWTPRDPDVWGAL